MREEPGQDRPRLPLKWLAWEAVKSAAGGLRRFVSEPPPPFPALPTEDKSGRAKDEIEDASALHRSHQTWGTTLVGWCYLLSLAAGAGFLFVYWYFDKVHWDAAAHNWLLGACLALFFAALGVGLVLHAHWLTIQRQATEVRPPIPSDDEEREAAAAAFTTGAQEVQRRTLLIGAAAAAVTVIAGIVISVLRSFAYPPDPTLYSTVWKRGQRLVTVDNKPIAASFLEPGSMAIVFPEDMIGSEKGQTVLVRVAEQALDLPEGRQSWAPKGYLAYSRVCTHAGCPVGMFEATTDQLMCPCHQSTFDVLRGAVPTGGPATRPLPQLPLYVDGDGNLRAAGAFSKPPGPGFWGMPE